MFLNKIYRIFINITILCQCNVKSILIKFYDENGNIIDKGIFDSNHLQRISSESIYPILEESIE